MARVLFVSDGSADGGLEAGLPPDAVVSRDRRRLNPLAMLLGRWDTVPADVLHVDGRRAVGAAGFAAFRCYQPVKLVYSGCGHVRRRFGDLWTLTHLHDADVVIARTAAEEARLAAAGLPATKLRRVPFAATGRAGGVNPLRDSPGQGQSPTPEAPQGVDTPRSPQTLVACGELVPAADFACAVFAFNGLRYAAPNAWLLIAGAGPDRQKLLDFAHNAAPEDKRVRVLPPTPGLVHGAAQAWVTHRVGGCRFALEAMAAGVPVLAADTPDLREVVGDAGLFFPPGDRGRLCELAFRLLEDPPRAHALGEAGRCRATEQFPPERLAAALAAVYHELAAL